MTTYIVLIQEKNSAQISDLAPGTAYLFRVQALSSDGSPGGSSMEEQFETLLEGTEPNHHGKSFTSFVREWDFSDVCLCFLYLPFQERLTQNNTAVIFGAAVGGAAMLFIVIVVLFLRRRSVAAPSAALPACLSC